MVAPRSPETSGAAWTVPLALDEVRPATKGPTKEVLLPALLAVVDLPTAVPGAREGETLDELVVVVVDVGGGESEVDVGDHRGLRVWGGSCDPHSRRC